MANHVKREELRPFIVNTVFISSTAQDLRAFREMTSWRLKTEFGVREAFPEHEWETAIEPERILAECRRRVFLADAFVLILGPWSGWVPTGYDKTITHLEFQWARIHFGQLKRSMEQIAEKWDLPELQRASAFPRILVLDLGAASARLDRNLPIIKKLTREEAKRIEPYLEKLRSDVRAAVAAREAVFDHFNRMEELQIRIARSMEHWDRLGAECLRSIGEVLY